MTDQEMQERLERLTARLNDGFGRIGEAMNKGVAPEHWETKWVELLREYENIEDELDAHHAEVRRVQAEMAGMPVVEREVA